MSSLPDLQRGFWRGIAATPGRLAVDDATLALVEPSATLDPAARLQVYVDAYFLRLRAVLADDFPRVETALGTEGFDDVVGAYLARHPSTNPSLRHLGDALPAFVASRPDLPPWLGDLARLERARTDVFDAPDDTVLRVDDLRRVPADAWPELRLRAIHALTLLHVDWPVWELWRDDAAPLQATSAIVRVWRGADYRVFHAPMTAPAAEALRRLMAGEPFAAICAAFEHLPPAEAAREVAALLGRWVDDGILAAPRADAS
jgi:hypothetical protein